MPSLALIKHFVHEVLSSQVPQRVPEPALVMADREQVDAYVKAGREDGPMAPTYLLHTLQLSQMIRPGDQVVDLACGPANQLCQVARLNPQASFLGVDLSENMLKDAQENADRQGLTNIRFQLGDITRVEAVADQSADLVMSTLSLHHLPTEALLQACFAEVARIVKKDGAVYLADFGRLKRDSTLEFFAGKDADLHPPLYVEDFRNSMRAAFPLAVLRQAAERLAFLTGVRLLHTFMVPFMVVIKTPARQALHAEALNACRDLWQRLPASQKQDFEDLRRFFASGGLRTPHPGG